MTLVFFNFLEQKPCKLMSLTTKNTGPNWLVCLWPTYFLGWLSKERKLFENSSQSEKLKDLCTSKRLYNEVLYIQFLHFAIINDIQVI
jgi:hypothetical protein